VRRDAVFCSAKCRQAIYWQRHTDYMKPNDRPTYVVVLRVVVQGVVQGVVQVIRAPILSNLVRVARGVLL
jgi:hypothetical protein